MKPTKNNIFMGLLLGSLLFAQSAWATDPPVSNQAQNNRETAIQAREQNSFTSRQQVGTMARNDLDELEVTMGVIEDDTAPGDNLSTIELPLQARDRLRDHDRIHDAVQDRDRDRDRLKAREEIEDMTRDRMHEMREYREQMQNDMRDHQSETMQDMREQTRQGGGNRMGM